MAHRTTYHFFQDSGHGWLEIPRTEVEASGADISGYSYYDPKTDMVYLEEDCDMWAFFRATGKSSNIIGRTVRSARVRRLPSYGGNVAA